MRANASTWWLTATQMSAVLGHQKRVAVWAELPFTPAGEVSATVQSRLLLRCYSNDLRTSMPLSRRRRGTRESSASDKGAKSTFPLNKSTFPLNQTARDLTVDQRVRREAARSIDRRHQVGGDPLNFPSYHARSYHARMKRPNSGDPVANQSAALAGAK